MYPNITKEEALTSLTSYQKTTLPSRNGGSIFGFIQTNNLNPNINDPKSPFKKMLMLISANYSIDVSNPNSPNFLKLQMIYSECVERNWSEEFFHKHLKKFLIENEYPTFNIAMFFKNAKEPKLRTHSEYLKLLQEIGESVNKDRVKFQYDGYYLWAFRNELTEEQINQLNKTTYAK